MKGELTLKKNSHSYGSTFTLTLPTKALTSSYDKYDEQAVK